MLCHWKVSHLMIIFFGVLIFCGQYVAVDPVNGRDTSCMIATTNSYPACKTSSLQRCQSISHFLAWVDPRLRGVRDCYSYKSLKIKRLEWQNSKIHLSFPFTQTYARKRVEIVQLNILREIDFCVHSYARANYNRWEWCADHPRTIMLKIGISVDEPRCHIPHYHWIL